MCRTPSSWVGRIVLLLVAAATLLLPVAHAAPTYTNPVILGDVPDPGVLYDAASRTWVVGTTGGDGSSHFALHTSPDLVNWAPAGFIFTAATWTAWGACVERHRIAMTLHFSARVLGQFSGCPVRQRDPRHPQPTPPHS